MNTDNRDFSLNNDLSPLEHCIKQLESWSKILMKSREAYLLKEAEKKHFEAKLVIKQLELHNEVNKYPSHTEALTRSFATEEYFKFSKELALLESKYENDKLVYEVLEKNYQAVYLETKQEQLFTLKQT